MTNNRRRRKGKSRALKRVLLIVGIPTLVVIVIFSMIFTILAGFMPSAPSATVEGGYRQAAELAGCTWQDLLAYDTVRYDNKLENVDPFLSATDFLRMYYEIWEYVTRDDGSSYWIMRSKGNLETVKEICDWLSIKENSTVSEIMEKAKTFTWHEYKVEFSAKVIDDLILEKSFNEKQIKWVDMLMTTGVMDAMFGKMYNLPDYIQSAGNGYFGWPTPELYSITSKFAASRKHPVLGITRAHNGVDISGANAMGSPVVSIDEGIVIQVDQNGGERGINVRIKHEVEGDVWVSRYQHLSLATAYVGQQVIKGTVIGAVGNTGIGTGAHLHLELTYNGVLLDPLPLISNTSN